MITCFDYLQAYKILDSTEQGANSRTSTNSLLPVY